MEVIRCRFLEYLPPDIICFAVQGNKCLVVFSDSSIHLYKTKTWSLLQRYPPHKQLNKVIWDTETTFVGVSQTGHILQYSLDSLKPIQSLRVPGNGIHDIAKRDHKYALACHDGTMRVYEVVEGDLELSYFYHKQQDCLLSVAWEEYIFAGSEKGIIYKWKESNPTALARMTSHSPIRALLALENVLFSGEEEGCVRVWDAEMSTLLQSIPTHSASIRCMTLKVGEVFVSGIDSKIVRLSYTGSSWVVSGKARGQSHHVYSLASYEKTLISGGVNTDICEYSDHMFEAEGEMKWQEKVQTIKFRRKKFRHVATLPYRGPTSAVSTSEGVFLLCTKNSEIELWKIHNQGKNAQKLFVLKVEDPVTSATISPSANWVVFSTMKQAKLVLLDPETLTLKSERTQLKPFSEVCVSAEHLFTGYKHLSYTNMNTQETLQITELKEVVTRLVAQGKWCSALLNNNRILICKEGNLVCELPTFASAVTSLGFGFKKKVFVSTEENTLYGFNLKTQDVEPYTHKFAHKFPSNFLKEVNRTIGIHSVHKQSLLLHTHYSFTYIDLKRKPPKKSLILVKESFNEHNSTWAGVLNKHPLHSDKELQLEPQLPDLQHFAINKRFGPILDLHMLKDCLLVVELPWDKVLLQKPAPFVAHKYGK